MKKILFLTTLLILSSGLLKAMEEEAFQIDDPEKLLQRLEAVEHPTEEKAPPEIDHGKVEELLKDLVAIEKETEEGEKSPLRERITKKILRTEQEKEKAFLKKFIAAEKVREKLENFGEPLSTFAGPLSRIKSDVRPIFISIVVKDPLLAKKLIDTGIALDARDGNGRTPLLWAIQHNSLPIVKLLIEQVKEIGADTIQYINARDKTGITALYMTAQAKATDIAKFLIDQGAQVNVKNIDDNTPLHYAALFNAPEIAELLIINGANIKARNTFRETPLDVAKTEEMKKLFEQYGEPEKQ